MNLTIARLALAAAVVAAGFATTPASAGCNSTAEYAKTRGACQDHTCPYSHPMADCDDGWMTPPDEPPGAGHDIRSCALWVYLAWGGYDLTRANSPMPPPAVCDLLVPPTP